MVETLNYEYPKDVVEYLGPEIKRGNDFIVFELGNNMVAKRPNLENQGGRTLHDYTTTEFLESMIEDNAKLKEIFGDNFVETFFYQPTQERNYIGVQKRFRQDQFLNEKLHFNNAREFIDNHRDEFMKIIYGTKKSILVFGFPADMHPGNLVLDNDHILFVETDCTSYRAHRFEENGSYSSKLSKDLFNLEEYEKLLRLTPEEKAQLNTSFGIDGTQYQAKIQYLKSKIRN